MVPALRPNNPRTAFEPMRKMGYHDSKSPTQAQMVCLATAVRLVARFELLPGSAGHETEPLENNPTPDAVCQYKGANLRLARRSANNIGHIGKGCNAVMTALLRNILNITCKVPINEASTPLATLSREP